MKQCLAVPLTVFLVVAGCSQHASPPVSGSSALEGRWRFYLEEHGDNQAQTVQLELAFDGTGDGWGRDAKGALTLIQGTVSTDRVSFHCDGGIGSGGMSGSLKDDSMEGVWELDGKSGVWSAQRILNVVDDG